VIPVEYSQPDKGIVNEAESPFCIDTDTNDILNWRPTYDKYQICFSSGQFIPREIFRLRTFSLFIWQPPEIA
jgi:hypothetical protein